MSRRRRCFWNLAMKWAVGLEDKGNVGRSGTGRMKVVCNHSNLCFASPAYVMSQRNFSIIFSSTLFVRCLSLLAGFIRFVNISATSSAG